MRWRIEQQADGTWQVFSPEGRRLTVGGMADQGDPVVFAGEHARADAIAGMVTAMGGPAAMVAALTAAPMAENGGQPGGDAAPLGQRWSSRAAFEGVVTNDGRCLQGATFRDTPLPLMWQTTTAGGHDGAELVGFADTVAHDGEGEGSVYTMAGVFQSGEHGAEAVTLLQEHGTFGVSVDTGWPEDYESECVQLDSDGWCNRWRDTYIGVPIIGLTGTPFPAFASACIWLEGTTPPPLAQQDVLLSDAPAPVEPTAEDDLLMLLASGAPEVPPVEWFSDPEFSEDTPGMEVNADGCPIGVPLTITPEGRVFGHVATWQTCHIGMPECTLAPRSPSGYAYFRTGAVRAVGADGEHVTVATGPITMGLGHADLNLDHRGAVAHYDDSRTGVADVAVGEDEFGIWFSGALRPGVTDEQARTLQALSLSGDWRPVAGALEMVAALAVNVPGFPIPRGLRAVQPALAASAMPAVRQEAGRVVALIAAGMVVHRTPAADPLRALAAALPALAPLVAAIEQLAEGQRTLLRRTEPMVDQAAERLRAQVASLTTNGHTT